MNVLLIQQDMGRRVIKYPMYPIGLSYLAAVIKNKNHRVKIFDPNVYDYPACYDYLEEEVRSFNPDVIGISIRNYDTTQRRDLFVYFNTVIPTIEVVRAIKPNVKTMVGGTAFSIFARQIMERYQQIDFGIYLEGEETVCELLENIDSPQRVFGLFYRANQEVVFTGSRRPPDFSSLPAPLRERAVIDMKNYLSPLHNVVGVQSKRGCIFECTYCSYLFLNERKLRLREPSSVVDEIQDMIENYGVEGFTFVDSVFNVPESHARDICNELIRRNIKVEWGAWLTPKNLTKDFIMLLKRAGCRHIGFSPDAATNEGLKVLKKGFTLKDVEKSLKIARQVDGMAVGYNLFCYYPGMDFKAVLSTLKFYFKVPLLLPGRGGCGLGWIRIEPHTDIYRRAIEEGIITSDTDMMPKDDVELRRLFYVPRLKRHYTWVFDSILFLTDDIIKPMVKEVFGFLSKIRGKKPFYE
ncbi:MAG: cobalamin-dependent protein [Candidatus Magnetoovum sp. WYHC-5]|nr:cobalamin-dependent protein [Candidatus Magnetoovum sp. WYHC-5]